MKVIFANILGGREFRGSSYGEVGVGAEVLDKYAAILASLKPDIVSLAEIHLDDKTHSVMVRTLANMLGLPHYDFMGSDASHLQPGKILGNAILSRYPITTVDHFIVEAPKLEVDRPNGDHWVLHNKLAQTAFIAVDDRTVALSSVHYFPFHHFNRAMNESAFAPQRQSLVDHLLHGDASTIPIITGDFNNKDFTLKQAFPELFTSGFAEALETETTIKGETQQFDHVLYRPADLTAVKTELVTIPSDHYGIAADFKFTD